MWQPLRLRIRALCFALLCSPSGSPVTTHKAHSCCLLACVRPSFGCNNSRSISSMSPRRCSLASQWQACATRPALRQWQGQGRARAMAGLSLLSGMRGQSGHIRVSRVIRQADYCAAIVQPAGPCARPSMSKTRLLSADPTCHLLLRSYAPQISCCTSAVAWLVASFRHVRRLPRLVVPTWPDGDKVDEHRPGKLTHSPARNNE